MRFIPALMFLGWMAGIVYGFLLLRRLTEGVERMARGIERIAYREERADSHSAPTASG